MLALVLTRLVLWSYACAALGVVKISSSAAYGRMVNEAKSIDEILVALEQLPKLGEERAAWEHDAIHMRRRRIALTSGVRKLSAQCVGSAANIDRIRVLNDDRLVRAVKMCGEENPCRDDIETQSIWTNERLEALRLLAALATQPQDNLEGNFVLDALVSGIESFDLDAENLLPCQIFTLDWIAERLYQIRAIKVAHYKEIKTKYKRLALPFRVYPNILSKIGDVEDLLPRLPLAADTIITRHGDRVEERRHTAWLAELGIGALAYSGKLMPPQPFDPIASVRDTLSTALPGIARYDCALINLYPDGGAACKYHHDPNHGLHSFWDPCECVLSVGEVRRFAFRPIHDVDDLDRRYTFHVFHGDVVHMFDDCQDRFQHCVFKTEDIKTNSAPRLSFVFKRALLRPNGKKGHGYICDDNGELIGGQVGSSEEKKSIKVKSKASNSSSSRPRPSPSHPSGNIKRRRKARTDAGKARQQQRRRQRRNSQEQTQDRVARK